MSDRASGKVLIIGGGIIGASIAWELARRRVPVLLCEASKLGGEASWAGAGMLVPGSEYDEPCEAFFFALESLQLYGGYVADLCEASGAPIDYSRCGSLELADTEDNWKRLLEKRKRQQAFGVESEVVGAGDLGTRVTGLRRGLIGALFYPLEGQVDPRLVLAALRIALREQGVTVLEEAPVRRLEVESGKVRILLESGEQIDAPRAVLAAGAWSSSIETPGLTLPRTYPVKGHLLGYPLAPGTLPHVLRFHHTYIVQRNSGYTIAGSSEEEADFDRSIRQEVASDLERRAAALAPGLLRSAPRDTWIGFRPGSRAPVPYAGRYENSPLWLAYGHYRNGILLAPATARRIAEQITRAV